MLSEVAQGVLTCQQPTPIREPTAGPPGIPRSRAPAGGSRGERVRRVLRILLQLLFHPEALTLDDLMLLLGVSRRTVYRDIQLLREIGLPLLFDHKRGHYCLLDTEGASIVPATVASIEGALSAGPPPRAPDTAQRPDHWPFNWEESVALLALLRAAPVPEGTEWRSILQDIDGELKQRIQRVFGRKSGSIAAHAALLAFKPHLSVAALRSSMERFWKCRMDPDYR